MLELTNAPAMFKAILDQQQAAMPTQVKQLLSSNKQFEAAAKDLEPVIAEYQGKMFDLMRKALDWNDMKPKLAALYNDMFTEEELAGIVAFYKTPVGQTLLKKMPELATRSMQLGQQQVQAIMPEIQKLNAEMREKARKIANEKAQ